MKPIFSPLPQINRIAALLAGLFLALATAWQAEAQVSLLSPQPPNGATDVPVNSTIVFTFSAPMDKDSLIILPNNPVVTGSIVFSANLTGTMNPSWDESQTVLTLDYQGNFPAGALITWTINPSGSAYPLYSEDLDFVPTTNGSFTTAGAICDPDGIPDELGTVGFYKSVTYLQTSSAVPLLKSDELPGMSLIVLSPAVDVVTAASFAKPGSASAITITNYPGFGYLNAEEFATQSLLDAAYPNGTYTFTLNRQLTTATPFPMPMPAVGSYPPTPQVTNFQLAQAIDPTQPFSITFNGFAGSTGGDNIQLTISDSLGDPVLSAPDLCVPLVLIRTATSFTIPANTLEAGNTYTARLSYGRSFYSSTTTPADFASLGALIKETVFTLNTAGGVVVPQPQVTGAGFQGGFFAFNVGNLVAATTYQVQYSTTLLPGSWQNVQAVTTATPQPIFDLDSNENPGQRFYRVIKP